VRLKFEKIKEENKRSTPEVKEEKFEIAPVTDLTPEEKRYLLRKISEYKRFPDYTKKVIIALVSGEKTVEGIMRVSDIEDRTTIYRYISYYIEAGWVTRSKEGRKNIYELNLDVIMADLDLKSLSDTTSEGYDV